jgi:hypothetical protein
MLGHPYHRSLDMDDERFDTLYRAVAAYAPGRGKRQQYSDAHVLLVLLWSALRRKPRSWACDPRNAPRRLRGLPLPSPSCLSRRLNDPAFGRFWQGFLAHTVLRQCQAICLLGCYLMDAKALPVSCYSKDKQAQRGWVNEHTCKGYKLFLLIDVAGRVVAYRVASLKNAEQTVALELVEKLDRPGYVVADSVHDTDRLHRAVAAKGAHLITPRKRPGGPIGKRAASPERLLGITRLETPNASGFSKAMYNARTGIERVFAQMSSSAVGLDSLPPWVRTLKRVSLWVEAMLVFLVLLTPPI